MPYTDLAPLRLKAIELRGRESSGRSSPLFVQCRSADSALVEVVLKLKDPMVPDQHPWRLCLTRELAGAITGRHLGLAVPNYAVVEVGREFIRSVSRTAEAERVRRSEGLNFGSVVVNNVLPDVSRLQDTSLWEDLLTFDSLVFNADRKSANPNVLWDGLKLYLIDHGLLAPTWTAAVDGLTPTTLYGEMNIRLHAAFERLRAVGPIFAEISDRWRARITTDFLTWLRTQIPVEWAPEGEINELFAFVSGRVGIADNQVIELRRYVT